MKKLTKLSPGSAAVLLSVLLIWGGLVLLKRADVAGYVTALGSVVIAFIRPVWSKHNQAPEASSDVGATTLTQNTPP